MNTKNDKQLLEFDDPFKGVHFPFDPENQVNVKECESAIEEFREVIASKFAQKYDLKYFQGDAIGTKNSNQINDIQSAHDEISKYMPVSTIRWMGEPGNYYYFTFDSWEETI